MCQGMGKVAHVCAPYTLLRASNLSPPHHLPVRLPRREYETRQDPQTWQLVVGPELPASQHAAKLRRLVVELAPPQVAGPNPPPPPPPPPRRHPPPPVGVARGGGGPADGLVVELAPPQGAGPNPTQPDPTPPGMNSEQHVAVQRVLAAQDYALVLGMPGAGKTTTIVAMVQALVAAGKSVLLTSYTNRWGRDVGDGV